MANVIWYDDLYSEGSDTKAMLYKQDGLELLATGTILDATSSLSVSHGFESGSSAVENLITSGLNEVKNWSSAAIRTMKPFVDGIKKLAVDSMSDEFISKNLFRKTRYGTDENGNPKYNYHRDKVSKLIDDVEDKISNASKFLVNSQIINRSSKYKKFTGTVSEIQVPQLTIYYICSSSVIEPKIEVINLLEAGNLLGSETDLVDMSIDDKGTKVKNSLGSEFTEAITHVLDGQIAQMPPHGFSYAVPNASDKKGSKGLLCLVTPTGIYRNLVLSNINILYSSTCVCKIPPKDEVYGPEGDIGVENYTKYGGSNNFGDLFGDTQVYEPLYIKVELSFEYGVLPTANEVKSFLAMSTKSQVTTYDALTDLIAKARSEYAEKMKNISDSLNEAENSILTDMIAAANIEAKAKASEIRGLSFLGGIKDTITAAKNAVNNARKFVENSQIMEYVNTATDAINQVGQIGNEMTGFINETTGMVQDVANSVQSVANSLNTAMSSISGVAGSLVSGINGAISSVQNIRSSFSSVIDTAGNIVSNTGDNIKRIQIL